MGEREIQKLHKLEIKDGKLFLDGMRMKGILAYRLIHKSNDNCAELSLKLDVRILGDKGTPEFDSALDECRQI